MTTPMRAAWAEGQEAAAAMTLRLKTSLKPSVPRNPALSSTAAEPIDLRAAKSTKPPANLGQAQRVAAQQGPAQGQPRPAPAARSGTLTPRRTPLASQARNPALSPEPEAIDIKAAKAARVPADVSAKLGLARQGPAQGQRRPVSAARSGTLTPRKTPLASQARNPALSPEPEAIDFEAAEAAKVPADVSAKLGLAQRALVQGQTRPASAARSGTMTARSATAPAAGSNAPAQQKTNLAQAAARAGMSEKGVAPSKTAGPAKVAAPKAGTFATVRPHTAPASRGPAGNSALGATTRGPATTSTPRPPAVTAAAAAAAAAAATVKKAGPGSVAATAAARKTPVLTEAKTASTAGAKTSTRAQTFASASAAKLGAKQSAVAPAAKQAAKQSAKPSDQQTPAAKPKDKPTAAGNPSMQKGAGANTAAVKSTAPAKQAFPRSQTSAMLEVVRQRQTAGKLAEASAQTAPRTPAPPQTGVAATAQKKTGAQTMQMGSQTARKLAWGSPTMHTSFAFSGRQPTVTFSAARSGVRVSTQELGVASENAEHTSGWGGVNGQVADATLLDLWSPAGRFASQYAEFNTQLCNAYTQNTDDFETTVNSIEVARMGVALAPHASACEVSLALGNDVLTFAPSTRSAVREYLRAQIHSLLMDESADGLSDDDNATMLMLAADQRTVSHRWVVCENPSSKNPAAYIQLCVAARCLVLTDVGIMGQTEFDLQTAIQAVPRLLLTAIARLTTAQGRSFQYVVFSGTPMLANMFAALIAAYPAVFAFVEVVPEFVRAAARSLSDGGDDYQAVFVNWQRVVDAADWYNAEWNNLANDTEYSAVFKEDDRTCEFEFHSVLTEMIADGQLAQHCLDNEHVTIPSMVEWLLPWHPVYCKEQYAQRGVALLTDFLHSHFNDWRAEMQRSDALAAAAHVGNLAQCTGSIENVGAARLIMTDDSSAIAWTIGRQCVFVAAAPRMAAEIWRRAEDVQLITRMRVEKAGACAALPALVALGEYSVFNVARPFRFVQGAIVDAAGRQVLGTQWSRLLFGGHNPHLQVVEPAAAMRMDLPVLKTLSRVISNTVLSIARIRVQFVPGTPEHTELLLREYAVCGQLSDA